MANFFSGGCGPSEEGKKASERKKKTRRPHSPIYSRGGVTGAVVRLLRGVGRIAYGRASLWPRVWACISDTRGGHRIARVARIICSGVCGI